MAAYLLDTQVFLWFENGDARLSPKIREVISSPRNEKLLSVASLWEIVIKSSLQKLSLSVPLENLLDAPGYQFINIQTTHLRTLHQLPFHHRDPFDRLLIAQAITEKLTVISSDEIFDKYGVERIF